jgi:uncharacterized repeat protein (TIGR03803 family)
MARRAANSTAFAARVLASGQATRYGRRNPWRKIVRCIVMTVLASMVLSLSSAARAQTYTEKVIHDFCVESCREGDGPADNVTRDSAGNFYGATDDGARSKSQGAIFELIPSGAHWKTKVLYRFSGKDYAEPRKGVILDTDGNIYGVARDQLFKLTPDADRTRWTLTTLYKFCHTLRCRALHKPVSRLTYIGAASGLPYDGVSPLYGTTDGGGAHNGGVVYQFVPGAGTGTLTVLYSFCGDGTCPDGMSPYGDIVASPEALYGVTYWGGNLSACSGTGCGVVYQLSPKGAHRRGDWKQTVLHRFCVDANCSDGMFPAGVTLDGAGALIGTAEGGGASGGGTIFKLTPSGENSPYNVLHSFCAACGETTGPATAVIIDGTGTLFGEANAPPGAVYRFDGSNLTTLHQFCSSPNCSDGDFTVGGLLLDETGNLFGATLAGGASDGGTIFELTPDH